MLRSHWRQGHPLLVPASGIERQPAPKSCPEFKLQSPFGDISNRSLSPWRYRVDRDESRIPEEIGVAECLCSGCIIDGEEDTAYNSVPVLQTMMFVFKEKCEEEGKYTIRKEMKRIPVACTCVTPT
ncbi:hypothetical protein ACEWY4_010396 [Coilia grayii]|uniref:Interleukin-17C n=1 Tax=Coilia grayii TaxID=363190 RepID=A0ABD1K1S5_9TELE